MKKVFAIAVIFTLMAVLVPASLATAAPSVEVEKYFLGVSSYDPVEEAALCDHVDVAIVLDTDGEGLLVRDVLPEGLTIVGEDEDDIYVDGGDWELVTLEGKTFEIILEDDGEYFIVFEVQVTDVLAYEEMVVENSVDVYGYDLGEEEIIGYITSSDLVELTLLPYEDFVKELADGENDYQVSRTVSSFDIVVNIENTIYNNMDEEIDMLDVMVKDNLPGNIVYGDWDVNEGSVENTKDNDGKKNPIAHLMWDLGDDLGYNDDVGSTLTVSTDTVGGKEKDKHNLKNAGSYTLNPGATLMFTASDTELDCTVQSAAVRVDVDPGAE